jgi:hypothetical protein
LAGVVVVEPQVAIDRYRKRIALARNLNFAKSVRGPAGGQQIDAVPFMGRRVVGIERDRVPEFRVVILKS